MKLRNESYAGKNTSLVTIGECDFYFSYAELIAFYTPATGMVVSENDWSTTTAKHINKVPGGRTSKRHNREAFEATLKKAAPSLFAGLTTLKKTSPSLLVNGLSN